ncbi:LIM and SH3 domain protein Lasp isoform X2 [Musca domestica]|uniref:LIM and SH3 domain protein Lasp isoform X2 n=1 Tax=Musca domestica TaxID=7370 RepID=A0ABM3V3R5_MUSDO|nr:LIM and SH3 domain protein Lasp isoform X2 [Musca domestica]
MNKTCARCQKVVYPIEELKCLDKTWHKTCFKCTECAMALNMKTYKGFNKMPYCEAHIPKAKATAIADTPELKRIAENTKIQSNVKYHEDFEKAKGKFTQVADDPETLRIKQNTKHISNVAYHGDLEKKAAMEKQRGAAEVSDTTKEQLAAEQFAQYAPQVHASHSPLPPQQLSPRMGVAPQQQAQQQQQTPSHALAPQHHQYLYTNTPATQQQTMPPPNIQQQQQQQHNTAHIVPSNQTLGMNSHSYQTNSSRPGPAQHQQHPYASTHQQQQQQQFIQHEQQQQQQQYQHYQQPQMMRQPQNLQQQQQSQTHGLKQSSHLYPSSSSSTPTTAGLSNLQGTSQYQQPNNSYNQLRSAILQSSHHPTGALIPNDSSMPALSTATPYNNTYDQYDNNSATSTTTGNNYPNNSQRATSQQHQQLYQQQQQQHQAHHNNNHLNSSGSNNNNGGLVVPPPLAYQAPKSSSAATTPSYGGGGGSNASTAQQQLFPNNAYTNSYQSSQATTQGGGIIGGTLNGGGQPQTNHHQHLHHHHNSNGGSAINGSIGKIADYDPLSDGPRPLPNTARSSTTLIYSSDNRANVNNFYAKRIGSIADIDPVNGIYGSLTAQEQQQQQQHHMSNHNMQQPQYYQQMPAVMQQQQQQNHQSQHHNLQQQQLQQQQKQTKQNLRIYRALYDYEAQDVDEVSFREGDIIFEVESIDSGWMTGRVERTGKTGMLPANYVEQAVI